MKCPFLGKKNLLIKKKNVAGEILWKFVLLTSR